MIAFDASSNGFSGTTPLTYSHICTGSNLILLVAARADDPQTISGITYNGVAMTQITSVHQATAGSTLYLFYLINPATGANNIVVTASGNNNIRSASASYTGVKQSSQPDASGSSTSSGTSVTRAHTTLTDQCWVIMATSNDVGSATGGTNHTQRDRSASVSIGDSDTYVTPAGSLSQTANLGSLTNWAVIQASIKPDALISSGGAFFTF